MFKCLGSKQKEKVSGQNYSGHSANLMFVIFSCIQFWKCVRCQSKTRIYVGVLWSGSEKAVWQTQVKVVTIRWRGTDLQLFMVCMGREAERDWRPGRRTELSARLSYRKAALKHFKTKQIKWKLFFHPMFPDFRRSITFCKVTRLRSFVFLKGVTCRWRWVWSNGGMILTGKSGAMVEWYWQGKLKCWERNIIECGW